MALVPVAAVASGCDPKSGDPDDEHLIGSHAGDTEDDGEDTDVDGEDTEDAPEPDPEPEPEPEPEPRPSAVTPCPSAPSGGDECTTEAGAAGRQFCIVVDGEELVTPCESDADASCTPGEGEDYGCAGDICTWNGEQLVRYSWEEDDCDTPLVVSFDGAPIEFAPAIATSFDLSRDGSCVSTDWPSAPWLALDRDGDGAIRGGDELFGNATRMAAGGHAEHGFAALAELDSDRDGKITAADARFGELVLWSDLDDDRVGTLAELRPLADAQLVSIDLAFDRRASCDAHGNCGYERAALEYRTASGGRAIGEVVDVHLGCR